MPLILGARRLRLRFVPASRALDVDVTFSG